MARFTEEQIIRIIEGRPDDVSVKDYCSQEGMHPRVFYYHRSRLAGKKSNGDQINCGTAKRANSSSAGFTPLKIKNKGYESPLAIVELSNRVNISIYDSAILPLLYPLLS